VPAAPAPVVQIQPEPLPVTPVPMPQIVIVQSPPPAPAPQQVAALQQAAAPQVNEEEQQALSLLVDLQRYAVEAGEDLRRELAAANLALTRARSDANRIRLAMLLTLPTAGPPDDARALSLLEPVVGRGGGNASPMKQIASLLYAQISERARSVREEQRKTAVAQEKLDALRAVERSLLLERSRNAGGGGAGGGGGTGR
jgi:hypothetical protein